MEKDILELEDDMKTLKQEYDSLEKQRSDNSSQGIQTSPETLRELDFLELPLSESRERYVDLKIKRDGIKNNVNLINGQIEKVGELIILLDETREPVNLAKEFVEVHVPYVLEEIKAQKSQIHSLFGVNKVMNFLEGQAKLAGVLNTKIKVSAEYLDGRVKQVRDGIMEKGTIYEGQITDGKEKEIEVESKEKEIQVEYKVVD